MDLNKHQAWRQYQDAVHHMAASSDSLPTRVLAGFQKIGALTSDQMDEGLWANHQQLETRLRPFCGEGAPPLPEELAAESARDIVSVAGSIETDD